MSIQEGEVRYGFLVTRVREVEELNASFVEMTHKKTGAQLCWTDNKAPNKLFAVSFKTLPEDSTGVFHILEHSVLCGSERYPVKEPFVDLLKGSMNTFLNAMTFPDKTVYPVSSRNRQDFLNLTSVYLDAVFAPMLLKNPNIFRQEGIHTELRDGKPSYRGVVFNEMKGAMSNVDDRIEEGISELVFPDTCYRHNSGGSPQVIPDLTYEAFEKTYREWYHPSNARFYLDGDVPLDETLEKIDSYLSRYEKRDDLPEIPLQTPVSGNAVQYYELPEGEKPEGKAILTFGKIIGTWRERNKTLAAKILCDVLCDSNESPLKRAVLSSGMAEDLEMAVLDGTAQPYLITVVRHLKDGDSGAVETLIRKTAERIATEGLDPKAISASINRLAFHAKQPSEPQGLHRALAAHRSWLYGGDPLTELKWDDAIATLRKTAEDGGFEDLLRELLVDPEGCSVLHLLPSATYGAEERKAEEARLKQEQDARSEEETSELLKQNEALSEWQTAPDSPEAAASLPVLPIEEVSDTPECIRTTEKTEQGVTVVYHEVPSQGTVSLSLYFPLTECSLEELTQLSFYPTLYGELPTARHTAAELQQKIKSATGNLNFGIGVFAKQDQTETCTPCLEVHAGILKEKVPEATALLTEILTETEFEHPEKIREIAVQAAETSRQAAIGSGHSLGAAAVQAHYTAKGAVNEAVNGYSYLSFLHGFARNFEGKIEPFLALVKRVQKEAVGRKGLTVSVTAEEEISVSKFLSGLPEGTEKPETAAYRTELPKRMGIRIPAQIGFAVKGYHLSRCGKEMKGSLRVAANILTLSYLWNEIRVQGGAYGAGFPVTRDGGIFCYSYRDPTPARSLNIYDKAAEFLNKFCEEGEDLNKFILSAIAATEPLRTPAETGITADEFRFSGNTDAVRKMLRRQMLATDRAALNEWCGILNEAAEHGAVCVVGSEEVLRACEDLTVFEL